MHTTHKQMWALPPLRSLLCFSSSWDQSVLASLFRMWAATCVQRELCGQLLACPMLGTSAR